MIKTSTYGLKLTEFQDTMGDEVAFANYNFNRIEDELLDTQSILEEVYDSSFGGEGAFENIKKVTDRIAMLEKEYGGVNLLRGTWKESNADLFSSTGLWTKGKFKHYTTTTTNTSVKTFTEAGIANEGRPQTELSTYIEIKGDNASRPEIGITQKKIPMQNVGQYTVSFFARKAKYSTTTPIASKNSERVKLKVQLVPTGTGLTDAGVHVFNIDNANWVKYDWTFNFEFENSSTYINSNNSTVDTDDTEIFGVLRDLIICGNINNTIQICGISVQRGAYAHDWSLSPFDVIDADKLLQKHIDEEAATRKAKDDELEARIKAEEDTRAAADAQLQTNINNEESARKSADATLQTNITKEETARKAADTKIREDLPADYNAKIGNLNDFLKYDDEEIVSKENLVAAINSLIRSKGRSYDDDKIPAEGCPEWKGRIAILDAAEKIPYGYLDLANYTDIDRLF